MLDYTKNSSRSCAKSRRFGNPDFAVKICGFAVVQGVHLMDRILRWGILGCGNISQQFCAGIHASPLHRLELAGSRDAAKASRFAQTYGVARSVGDYDALIRDPSINAVYVALPNSMHHEWTLKALNAGKHVLCEKPIATTAHEAQEMFDVADKQGVRLVEAFMYRSHPQTRAILDDIRNGEIGDVRIIRTSFCIYAFRVDGNIRFDRALAGGALMDVGCYCVNFSRMIAQAEPDRIVAMSRLHESGVDEVTQVSLHFPNNILATFTCALRVQADNTAEICGTGGYMRIPWPWKPQQTASYSLGFNIPPRQDVNAPPARQPVTRTVNADRPLYLLEADDFAATVFDSARPAVTREDSIGNIKVLDEVRRQIGLAY
jgi:predicted dehydrogenase